MTYWGVLLKHSTDFQASTQDVWIFPGESSDILGLFSGVLFFRGVLFFGGILFFGDALFRGNGHS